jgi:hypothetical protein
MTLFFILILYDKNGDIISLIIGKKYRKKQYDGSYSYIIEVKDKDLNEIVQLDKLYNEITINYIRRKIFID